MLCLESAKIKEPTLADIARAANVAMRTASKVFSGEETVRPYIKERVLKIAAELNYKPNRLAQALRNRSFKLVSFFVHDLDNPYFGGLFQNIYMLLGKRGFMVSPCSNIADLNDTNQMAFACATILTGPDEKKARDVKQRGPVVAISADPSQSYLELASTVIVNFKPAYEALAHELLKAGRRKIALYCLPRQEFEVNRRIKFKHAEAVIAAEGLSFVAQEGRAHLSEAAEIAELLQKRPDGIDALICSNDPLAATAFAELGRLGKQIPDDITVVGCDATLSMKGLWTVKVDTMKVAKAVVELLMESLENDSPNRSIEIVPELVKG